MYVFGVPLYFYENGFFHALPMEEIRKQISSEEILHDDLLEDDIGKDHPQSSTSKNPFRLGFFSGNFTRNEVQLSRAVMSLWANFIRTG